MKKFLLTLSCVALMATAGYSQTVTFSFTDNGLYGGNNTSGSFLSSDTFTLSLFGMITGMPTGFAATGYSFWIEAPTGNSFNLSLSITGRTFFQFTDGTQNTYPKVFTDSSGAHSGFLSDMTTGQSGDLGATADTSGENFANGFNAHLADYTFSLAGAPAGTYTIFSTTVSPKQSEISYDDGTTFAFTPGAAVAYTITVVPEPATWSLLALGGLGAVGMTMLRRRRSA